MNPNRAGQPIADYRPSRGIVMLCAAAILIGTAAMAIAFATSPRDAWLMLAVEFVFFFGTMTGMLAWAAIFRTAQARWTPAVNRLAHSALAFAPVLGIVLAALLIGARNWVPWVTHPVPAKAGWLNLPFMAARDIAAVLVLWVLYFLLVRWSLKADGEGEAPAEPSPLTPTLSRSGERESQSRLNSVACAAVFAYAIASTIIAWDFIMCLSPEWTSTVFAPYIFCTNVYAGMAVLILMAALLRRPMRTESYLGPQQFQDMGNLMLGFALFNMGLLFAQYLTIWYENLPNETSFILLRYVRGGWPYLGWAAFMAGYAIPFILLQSKKLKRNPKLISPVAILALLGVALERYVLIVPSVEPGKMLLAPAAIVSALAFLGAFVLAVSLFLTRYGPVSAADAALGEVDEVETAVL